MKSGQRVVESPIERSSLVRRILWHWNDQAEKIDDLNGDSRFEVGKGMSGKGKSVDISLADARMCRDVPWRGVK